MKRFIASRSNARGFSLLEVLLATFVLVGLVVAATEITNGYIEREVAKSSAGKFRLLTQAMATELQNTVVFDAYYTATGGTTPVRIYIDNNASHCPNLLRSCTVGGVLLPPSRQLGNNIVARSLNNSDLHMLLLPRMGTAASCTTKPENCRSLEIVLLDSKPSDKKMATLSVNALGMGGGRVQYTTDKSHMTIVSNTQSWAISPSEIIASTAGQGWYNSLPVMKNDESIAMNFARVNRAETIGDYMYRTKQADNELNTMHAPLSMLQNNIIGADLVTAGNISLNGGLHLRGIGTSVGGLSVANGDVLVSKSTASGAPIPGQSAVTVGSQINVSGVGGVFTKSDINVSNTLGASVVRTNSFNASNGASMTVDKIGIVGGKTNASKLNAVNANVFANKIEMTGASASGGLTVNNRLVTSQLEDGAVDMKYLSGGNKADVALGSAVTNTGEGVNTLNTNKISGPLTVNGKAGAVDGVLLRGSLKLGQFGDCGVDCQ